jgi:hypothetical protein
VSSVFLAMVATFFFTQSLRYLFHMESFAQVSGGYFLIISPQNYQILHSKKYLLQGVFTKK